MAEHKEAYQTDFKSPEEATIEDVSLKGRHDAVAIATAEEHSLSMKDALLNNKRVLWWCFFFAMSAIGWYVLIIRHLMNMKAFGLWRLLMAI